MAHITIHAQNQLSGVRLDKLSANNKQTSMLEEQGYQLLHMPEHA